MARGGDGVSGGGDGVAGGEPGGVEGPRWMELGEEEGAIKAEESKFGRYSVREIFPPL